MFKYISLDLETTGLDEEVNQIVEVGAVFDTRGGPATVECRSLPKFRAVLILKELVTNPYCANLHASLWAEMLKATVGIHTDRFSPNNIFTYYVLPQDFEEVFYGWLYKVMNLDPFITQGVTINVAGKNPAGFDIPFLLKLPGWRNDLIKFHRRVIDPAILCFDPEKDEVLPDLQTCLNRCGIDSTVKHTAVEDAMDIIKVLRNKWNG